MNKRAFKFLLKPSELIAAIIIYAVYLTAILLTTRSLKAQSLLESITYITYIHFILISAFLYYLSRHESYVLAPYCKIRFKSNAHAYVIRVKYLFIESAVFALPLILIITVFDNMSGSVLGAEEIAFNAVNIFFGLIQIGILIAIIRFKTDHIIPGYLPTIFVFLLLSFDCLAALGFFRFDFSILYKPMLYVFMTEEPLYMVNSILMLLKAAFLFVIGLYLLLPWKKRIRKGDVPN